MAHVETGPAVTMTESLLTELSDITAAPDVAPDGYATAAEIAAATGLTKVTVYDRLAQSGAGHVDVRRQGQRPIRYYDLAALVKHLRERRRT